MGTYSLHAVRVGSIFHLSLTCLVRISRGPWRRLMAVMVPQKGVEVFFQTDARRACSRGGNITRWACIPEVQVQILSRGFTFLLMPSALSFVFL